MASLKLPKEQSYDFLKKITDDFSEERKISEDPFGILYKVRFCLHIVSVLYIEKMLICSSIYEINQGIGPDDIVIAVKKLKDNAPLPSEKILKKEAMNIMGLLHENIVQLVGFCFETSKKLVKFDNRYFQADVTECLLCYEYLPMGSLQEILFGKKTDKGGTSAEQGIDWDTRFKIIKGICQGLRFLHKLDSPIIHMDLKPEHIWLDENFVPKIVDFELSRVFGEDQTRLCTQTVIGSYGYMAPEYLYRGEISTQSDIYSLGVMIIEITTGELNCQEVNQPSARKYIDKVREDWSVEHIASKYSSLDIEGLQQVCACIDIGLRSVNIDRRSRPPIEEIADTLNSLRASKVQKMR